MARNQRVLEGRCGRCLSHLFDLWTWRGGNDGDVQAARPHTQGPRRAGHLLQDGMGASPRPLRTGIACESYAGGRLVLQGARLRCSRNLERICWGTGSSNPYPSSRQSVSLPQSFSKVENPAFRAGLGWWLGDRVGRDARVFDIEPIGGNISVGPNSSTAVRLMWWRDCRAGPNEVGPSLTYGRSLNPDWAQAKPSTIR